MSVVKVFKKNLNFGDAALTLEVSEVSEKNVTGGHHERTHKSGWTVGGYVHEDWYVWVNEFKATHKKYGKVWGDFEEKVYADSEEGFQDFYKNHPPSSWDYWDI